MRANILRAVLTLSVLPVAAMTQATEASVQDNVISAVARYMSSGGSLSKSLIVSAMTHCPSDLRIEGCSGPQWSPSQAASAKRAARGLAGSLGVQLTEDLDAANRSRQDKMVKQVGLSPRCGRGIEVANILLTSPVTSGRDSDTWRVGIDVQTVGQTVDCAPVGELMEFIVGKDERSGQLRVIARKILHIGHGAR